MVPRGTGALKRGKPTAAGKSRTLRFGRPPQRTGEIISPALPGQSGSVADGAAQETAQANNVLAPVTAICRPTQKMKKAIRRLNIRSPCEPR